MKRTFIRLASILLPIALVYSVGLRAEWVKDGVALCPYPSNQWYGYITTDGAGGAIIAWEEVRTTYSGSDIYCQHIDRDGNILWTSTGVPICTSPGTQMDPQIVADGAGGAVIAWRDERSGTFHIYAQRIDANGVVQWSTNGVCVVAERYGQYMPSIVPDGLGNFVITWRDSRSGAGQVYYQKLDGNGNPLWMINGIALCPTAWWQNDPIAIPDASGGAIVVWKEERYSILNSYIYAQRIDQSGNKLWAAEGAPITLSSGIKWHLDCVEDTCGGAFIAWSSGNDGHRNIFAQRIDSTGAIWVGGDVPVCTVSLDQNYPDMVLDKSGGAIIAWRDQRDSTNDVYAQRLTGVGDALWASNGIPVSRKPALGECPWANAPALVPDEAGGAIIAWEWWWETPANCDIFAQRIDPDGNLLWPDTAVSVCRAPGGQFFPQITANGEGGAIITWRDMRQDTIGAVYAMRVTANGETVATLLQSWAASIEDEDILIEWCLSKVDEDVQFVVLRSASGGAYEELGPVGLRREGLSFSFLDGTCRRGIEYRYRVAVETDGETRVLFETGALALPALKLALWQNYPNPFNPSTTIWFELPGKDHVRLAIYNCAGREMVRLLDGECEGGRSEVVWGGKDSSGMPVSSGVYFYRLSAGKQVITRKMVLLR